MKNEILDDIFGDPLRNKLVEGEKVIWEGEPKINQRNKIQVIFAMALFISGGLYLYFKTFDIIVLFYAIFGLSGLALAFFKRSKTRYLLTDQRVLFQLPDRLKTQIHTLDLDQIKYITTESTGKTHGVIFFQLKGRQKSNIKTYNLRNNEPRHKVTLELVENVDEVAGYIREIIDTKSY